MWADTSAGQFDCLEGRGREGCVYVCVCVGGGGTQHNRLHSL
jgi:hypothetical protein